MISGFEIKACFRYKRESYQAVLSNGFSQDWYVRDMRKVGSSRNVSKQTMEKVGFHLIKESFMDIYKTEQKKIEGFQYWY